MISESNTCGPPCENLLGLKNGAMRHRYAVLVASGLPRSAAHKKAGFEGKSRQSRHDVLHSAPTFEAFLWHVRQNQKAAESWGAQLREITRARAKAKVTDYLEYGDPDRDGLQGFLRLLFEGVEDRSVEESSSHEVYPGHEVVLPAGRRQATEKQLVRAAEQCSNFRLKPSRDLTEDEAFGIAEVKRTRAGDLSVKTTAGEAAKLSAQLEGLVVERTSISFESQQGQIEEVNRAWFRAIEAVLSETMGGNSARNALADIAGRAEAALSP